MLPHFTFCASAQNRKHSLLNWQTVYNALITHQSTDYLLLTPSQYVKHLITLRLLSLLVVLMKSLTIYRSPEMFCLTI